MSSPVSAFEARHELHWTAKSNYRLRTISFAIMFTSIVFHTWGKGYNAIIWGLITLHLLVYPHLMYWRTSRSAQSQQTEVNNLAVDSLLFGILAAGLGFPLWIAFTVYIASTLNITISRGKKGMLLSQLLFFSGALISITIFGWRFSPETDLPATLVCLLGNTFYMIAIGITAFGRNQQLRETREILRLNEKTLKQQISEIKSLQNKLNEEMEARVEQRTKEQVKSEKIASLGTLVVGIAHEMNTPIGNAILAASMLGDEMHGLKKQIKAGNLRLSILEDSLDRTDQATIIVLRSLQRTAELIRSFIRVSVIRSTQERKNFGLADLVGDMVRLHCLGSGMEHVEFKVLIPASVRMQSYPESLSQLLEILIENASVHGFEGRTGGTIHFNAEVVAGRVKLHISDNGKGIAPEDLPKIFDPFFTTRLGRGGNGLGLSVAWNIMTGVLGGTMQVVSEAGIGTTFFLDIPTEAPNTFE